MAFATTKGAYLILLLMLLEDIYVNGFRGRTFTDGEWEQLKIHNKPYVKSFKIGDSDFDAYDCVKIYQQPALSHPLLKGHKIQMSPSNVPMMDHDKSTYRGKDVDSGNQTEACPAGTVPIRKTSKEELAMDQILMKSLNENNDDKGHYFSIVTLEDTAPYKGAYAVINTQSPHVVERAQFSEAIVRITTGTGDEFNIVQAGWTVFQALYNDTTPRLVTSWSTKHGGKSTGCYNTNCPGFVQVHRSIAPGFPLTSSTYGGDQWETIYLIYKDRYTGNWWLVVGQQFERIGYWPKALFTGLQGSGDLVGWGGQVFGPVNKPSPPMGSGHFAEEGFKKAAYFSNLQYLDAQYDRNHPRWDQLSHVVQAPKCYTLAPNGLNGIFYGGPGGNCST